MGFVIIDKKITEWEWYKDVYTYKLFTHALWKANWKDGNFKGVEVPRGSFVTSLPKLAEESGLTIQQTRTALKHLISTGEITDKSYTKFRIITVNNYDLYQLPNSLPNSQLTDNQQTTNRQLTSIEQYNNNNKYNNITSPTPSGEDAGKKPKKNKSVLTDEELQNLVKEFDFSPCILDKLNEWLAYRKQIKQPYKSEIGFKTTLKDIKNAIKNYGEDLTLATFNESMKNSWQGLFFDDMAKKKQKGVNSNGRNGTNNTRDNRVSENSKRSEPYAGSAEWYERLAQKAKDMATSGDGENPRDLPFT